MQIFSKLKFSLFFLLALFLVVPNFAGAQSNKQEVAFYQAPSILNLNDLPQSEKSAENQVKNREEAQEKAQENNKVNIYFFYSQTCPHCHKEAVFLSRLKQEYQDKIEIYSFEVTANSANVQLFKKFGQVYKADVKGVPVAFIGDKHISGYYNDEYTGAEIRNLVDQCLVLKCHDPGRHILFPDEECNKGDGENKMGQPCLEENKSKIVNLPFIGSLDLQNLSLGVVTLVLGALDGFNPCAMWVLIFLISLLLSVESVKRRWVLGITFIVASAIVYYLFMAAWLNMFLFIGYLLIVRIIIGILAISFGIYNLRKYIKNKAGTCEVTAPASRRKILEKIKKATLTQKLAPAVIGIILLAFAVNLIELVCSAGFPAVYTKILASQNLSSLSYYLYLLFYIIIFMLDDIIVFVVAMITLHLTGVDSKYAKFSNLIGGIIILILGILLIIKPSLLTFR